MCVSDPSFRAGRARRSPRPAFPGVFGRLPGPLAGVLLSACLQLTTTPALLAADRSLLKAMEEEIATLMEKNRPSVVSIHAVIQDPVDGGLPASLARQTVGTGVLFDRQGHILTTSEVVEGADYIQVSLPSGRMADADMVAVDDDSRVAVIRLKEPFPGCPRFGDSRRIRTGHYAFVIGNAYGKMAPSVGTVVDFRSDDDLIQISGSAWPGNSGAAVFNSDGQVVGIVRGILAPSTAEEVSGPNGIGPGGGWIPATLLAIPINHARQVAQRLISGGWLGVEVERHGVTAISRVEGGGPASEAGLRVGDEFLSYNGERIRDGEHLRRLVTSTPVGSQVSIGLQRGDQQMTCQVQILHRPARASRSPLRAPSVSLEASRHGIDSPEMLLQRIRELEQQMQLFLQQKEGPKGK